MDYVINNSLSTEKVGYIDADCYFFGDVATCFSALDPDMNIGAHGHNFSGKRKHWEDLVGKFNVGLVIGRKSEELSRCIQTWKNQVLLSCTTDTTTGNFGDQKYLDSWPLLYKGFIELTSVGIGVAPWNIDHLNLSANTEGLRVNGSELIFYHFHGIRQVVNCKYFSSYQAAKGYSIKRQVRKKIYISYIRELSDISLSLSLKFLPENKSPLTKRDLFNLISVNFFRLKFKLVSIF
jgi:hypothetical protein